MAEAKQLRRKNGHPPVPGEFEWSKFEEDLLGLGTPPPDSSHMPLSDDSSGTPKFDRIFVFAFYSSDDLNLKNGIYSIDIVNSVIPPPLELEPIITWDVCPSNAVAVVGSKLYMFGANLDRKNGMHIYDMRPALSSPGPTIHLDIESLPCTGPDMSGSKYNPAAVVIGDSKICVFGTILCSSHVDPYKELFASPSFELFDTRASTWESLPEPLDYDKFKCVSIQSYCVHRSCCLIIQTNQGIYGINVDTPTPKKWVELYGSEMIQSFPFQSMWAMVDKQLIGPFTAMTRRDLKEYYPFPEDSYSLNQEYPEAALCLAGVHLFIVRVGCVHSYSPSPPKMLVDVIKFDHDGELQQLGSQWQSEKSFTFSLSHLCALDSQKIIVFACFATKALDTSEEDDISVPHSDQLLSCQ